MSFFGLSVEPGKVYEMEVEEPFRITMASLGKFDGNARSTLKVHVGEDEFVLCNLVPNRVEQQNLDIMFAEGDAITLKVEGKNPVHVTGSYLPDPIDGMFDGEDEEIDSDEVGSDEEVEDAEGVEGAVSDEEEADGQVVEEEDDEEGSEVEDGEEEEGSEDEEESEEEEVEEEVMVGKGGKRAVPEKAQQPAKKQRVEEVKPAVIEVKKEEKKPEPVKKEQPKEQPKKEETKKTTLPSGLVIEDVKQGDGARSKNGKRVQVRYIGKLTNGKTFDSNTKGKPFSFILGKGEVIKGWDLGLQNMQVGGMRRLTIPANLAYGNSNVPGIPKNSTLIFDIKLLGVN